MAIDRMSKFAFAQLHEKATRRVAANFLHALAAALPYTLLTVLTDNGVPFTDTLPNRTNLETEAAIWATRGERRLYRVHAFDGACIQLGIEHRLTEPCHPWTKGQVEQMHRTPSPLRSVAEGAIGGADRGDATMRRYHYASRDERRAHVQLFLDACNHARCLKP